MKKIIAAAVTAAFVAPAFAADVTLSGSQEFNYQDNNGTTTAEIDGTMLPLELLHKPLMASMSAQSSNLMMRVGLTAVLASRLQVVTWVKFHSVMFLAR